jgi:hypothetical protein
MEEICPDAGAGPQFGGFSTANSDRAIPNTEPQIGTRDYDLDEVNPEVDFAGTTFVS